MNTNFIGIQILSDHSWIFLILDFYLVFFTKILNSGSLFFNLDYYGFYNYFFLDLFVGNFFYYFDLFFLFFLLFFILYTVLIFKKEYLQNVNLNLLRSLNILSLFLFTLCLSYLFLTALYNYPGYTLFNQLIIITKFILLIKFILCFFSFLFLFFIKKNLKYHGFYNYEFSYFYLFSFLGILFSFSSNDFLSLFCGLEVMNLSLYVLAAFIKRLITNLEAGTKYLILGSISTGIFLKGVSLIYLSYGITNFINLDVIEFFFLYKSFPSILITIGVGILLITISFLFKLGVAPFHSWVVDVYGGTSLPITGFFATIIKSTVFLIFTMLSFRLGWPLLYGWEFFLLFLGIFSAIIGALGALRQYNIKKFLAYSSINHAGFLVLFLSFYDQNSLAYALIYLFSYVLTMLFIFILLINLTGYSFKLKSFDGYINKKTKTFYIVNYFSDLQNISKTKKTFSLLIALLLFSLGGIPPFLGFFPKLTLLKLLLDSQHFLALVIVICLSILSLGYYLRLIKIIYFDRPSLNYLNVVSNNKFNYVYENIKLINRIDGFLLFFVKMLIFIFLLSPFYFNFFFEFFYSYSWYIMYPFS